MTTVAVLNYSGNVGKTLFSKHLLTPLMDASRIHIEDINTGDGESDVEITSDKFKQLAKELNTADDDESFVIDIGASTAQSIMAQFDQLRSTMNMIDFWVLPVVADHKQKTDTAKTMRDLTKIGVPAEKIVVIANRVENTANFEEEFAEIIAVSKATGIFFAPQGVLLSDAYGLLTGSDETVISIAEKPSDFKKLKAEAKALDLANSSGKAELYKVGERMVLEDLALFAAKNLKAVFESTPIALAHAGVAS